MIFRPIQKVHALWMIALNITLATAISMPMFLMQKLVDYGNFCGQFCTEDWGNNEFGRSTYGMDISLLDLNISLIKWQFYKYLFMRWK